MSRREDNQRIVAAEIESYVTAFTDDAVGFKNPGDMFTLWIPKSQIEWLSVRGKPRASLKTLEIEDYVIEIEIPAWLAEDRNLAYTD